MKRAIAVLLAAGSGVLVACGSSDPEPTPAACLQGAGAYLAALERAPEPVAVEGVPIGDCLVPDQAAGPLNDVGTALVAAATRLNAAALAEPRGEAALRLGYLVGAVERGAAETSGIHADLVRRLNSAARASRDGELPGAAFERTFGRGYVAGREGA